MSLIQCIKRMLCIKCNENELPPHYNDIENDNPPEYDNNESKKYEKEIQIKEIINNIRNNKYNLGALILDATKHSPVEIFKYLTKNYNENKDIMLYLIRNSKHNHIIKIGKHNEKIDNDKYIFILGPIDLDITINNNTFNFSKYPCGVFSSININEKGWNGNAIHCIGAFNSNAIDIDKFIKLF